ncbi:hypothetical protein PaeBR_08105 [Paenibacillus sp. BR2-3]
MQQSMMLVEQNALNFKILIASNVQMSVANAWMNAGRWLLNEI